MPPQSAQSMAMLLQILQVWAVSKFPSNFISWWRPNPDNPVPSISVRWLFFRSYKGASPGEDNQPSRGREKIKCLKNIKKVIAVSTPSLLQMLVQQDLRLEEETKAPGKAEGHSGTLGRCWDRVLACRRRIPYDLFSPARRNSHHPRHCPSRPHCTCPHRLFVRWHFAPVTLQLCPHARPPSKMRFLLSSIP